MEHTALNSIEVLPSSQIFEQRENGKVHTPYETEILFYSGIQSGDKARVQAMLEALLDTKIITGKMSENPLRQMQYWAVCCIALAARYAIQGGLDETIALNLADRCILQIDRMTDGEEIFSYLLQKCMELTDMVAASRENSQYPYAVRHCLHYIHTHLHEGITCGLLAKECKLSPDYLSALFKKHTGIPLAKYIRKQKLHAAKDLLDRAHAVSDIAYYLGFCSESYFITCFKTEFGITPRQYADTLHK